MTVNRLQYSTRSSGKAFLITQSELQVGISSGSGKIRSAEIAQGANRHHPRRAASGC
jgi:hypothetical protein